MKKQNGFKQCPACGKTLIGWSDILVCDCGWTSEAVRKICVSQTPAEDDSRRERQRLSRANRGIKRFSI